MTEKDLKRMGRGDLLEILLEQGEQLEELKKELSWICDELDHREEALKNIASLAEASLLLIRGAALDCPEDTDRQYLENSKKIRAERERLIEQREAQRRAEAARVLEEQRKETASASAWTRRSRGFRSGSL